MVKICHVGTAGCSNLEHRFGRHTVGRARYALDWETGLVG